MRKKINLLKSKLNNVNNVNNVINLNYANNKIQLINSKYIGIRNEVLLNNKFNTTEYMVDYKKIDLELIFSHVFRKINMINWLRKNCYIDKNGEITNYIRLKIDLPNISDNKPIIEKCKINYSELFVYSDDEINFDTFIYAKSLTKLYIEYENFNKNLINLPNNLIILSICSKLFNQNLNNLPESLEYLYINSNCFDTELTNLPINLKVLSIVTSKLSVRLDNLPQKLKILHLSLSIINNRDIFSFLPESLEYLYIKTFDINNINLNDLPQGLKFLIIEIVKPINNVNIDSILPKNIIYKYIGPLIDDGVQYGGYGYISNQNKHVEY